MAPFSARAHKKCLSLCPCSLKSVRVLHKTKDKVSFYPHKLLPLLLLLLFINHTNRQIELFHILLVVTLSEWNFHCSFIFPFISWASMIEWSSEMMINDVSALRVCTSKNCQPRPVMFGLDLCGYSYSIHLLIIPPLIFLGKKVNKVAYK